MAEDEADATGRFGMTGRLLALFVALKACRLVGMSWGPAWSLGVSAGGLLGLLLITLRR